MKFVSIKVILKTPRTKNIFPKQIMRVYKTNMRTLNIKNKEWMEKDKLAQKERYEKLFFCSEPDYA